MLAHMQAADTAEKGHIYVGGMVTSIAREIGLEVELATLDHLPIHSLDITAFLYMRLIKTMMGD